MKKGEENAAAGKINIARLFYKRAFEKGSADAALALARTYDPDELQKMNVVGMEADEAMAEKWYQRAIELDSQAAETYLRNK